MTTKECARTYNINTQLSFRGEHYVQDKIRSEWKKC